MNTERITLYYREGSADKVYQAGIEEKNGGFVVNFAFGRRGATLQTGTKTNAPVPLEKAKVIYDKLIKEKTGKGYTPGEDGTPYQHTDNEQRDSGLRCQLLNPVDDAQLARLMDNNEYWLQEKKDGKRMLLRREKDDIAGINRKGLTVGLPKAIIAAAKVTDHAFVMDGECVGDKLHAFDLIWMNGADLRELSYAERLRQLGNLLNRKMPPAIELVETAIVPGNKRILFERLKKEGREGIVLKCSTAPYTAGRPNNGGAQLKYKFYATASLIVAKINDKRSVALELMASKKERVEAGNVTIPPNAALPKEGCVVEIRYLYCFRESGRLYQPTFIAVRDDIDIKDCTTKQLKYRAPDEDDDA